ncbi:nibrin [Pelomyxa schiedti]|nr:nibrin [Pelomyxa schiedti]
MWVLKGNGANNKDKRYCLLGGMDYTLGRINCDIMLEDRSVSRVHAEIRVPPCPKEKQSDPNIKPELMLFDKSKFGTFRVTSSGDIRVTPNQSTTVRDGEVIKFGLAGLVFLVCWEGAYMCFSGPVHLDHVPTEKIGYIVVSPEHATHLITQELSLTPKTVIGIGRAIPLVTPEWISSANQKKITLENGLPDCHSFLPPIASDYVEALQTFNLHPVAQRKTLFSDMNFVFLDHSQYQLLSGMVACCNGHNWTWFTSPDPPENLDQCKKIFAVSPAPENISPQTERKLHTLKSELNATIIPEDQIAMCILMVSVSPLSPALSSSGGNEGSESPTATVPKQQPLPATPVTKYSSNSTQAKSATSTVKKTSPKPAENAKTTSSAANEFKRPTTPPSVPAEPIPSHARQSQHTPPSVSKATPGSGPKVSPTRQTEQQPAEFKPDDDTTKRRESRIPSNSPTKAGADDAEAPELSASESPKKEKRESLMQVTTQPLMREPVAKQFRKSSCTPEKRRTVMLRPKDTDPFSASSTQQQNDAADSPHPPHSHSHPHPHPHTHSHSATTTTAPSRNKPRTGTDHVHSPKDDSDEELPVIPPRFTSPPSTSPREPTTKKSRRSGLKGCLVDHVTSPVAWWILPRIPLTTLEGYDNNKDPLWPRYI